MKQLFYFEIGAYLLYVLYSYFYVSLYEIFAIVLQSYIKFAYLCCILTI